MKNGLEERLRQLELGRPDPALRRKVLDAVDAGLNHRPESFSWRDRLAAWRVETLLTAGVAAAALLLLMLEPITVTRSISLVPNDPALEATVIGNLHPGEALEARYEARIQRAARTLAAQRRVGYGHRIFFDDEK